MSAPGWLKEPLVHFLLGGALLFAFFAWQGSPADPASRVITVDSQALAGIASSAEQQMGRAPTDSELDALIERYVREEILYREALRLGLDQDDAVVRRRLAQKMDLIAAGQAELATPSDAVLEAWREKHPQRFAADARYSLDQLWFAEQTSAQSALNGIEQSARWQELGSSIDLPASIESAPRAELLDRFGQQFVREVEALDQSAGWQGPVPSGLGWHLVRIREVSAATLPPLSEIRQRVENDWREATAAQREAEAYAILRDAYDVTIKR